MNYLIELHLTDSRRGKNTQLPLADLLRQSVYSRLAGYEDVNDAARVSADPAFQLIGSEKIWDRAAALTSRLQPFETELLAEPESLAGLCAINRELIAKAVAIDSPQRWCSMSTAPSPVYGQRENSAYKVTDLPHLARLHQITSGLQEEEDVAMPHLENEHHHGRNSKKSESSQQAVPRRTKDEKRERVAAVSAARLETQIAQIFGVHPTQVGGWKKQALAGLPDIFGNGREQIRQQSDAEKDELYKQIGQLKVELDFLKKELASSTDKRPWIDPAHPHLNIQQQCELLGMPRSTYYYQPRPESAETLRLLRQLDQLYLKCPFYGSRKMAFELEVNRKRIQRLMLNAELFANKGGWDCIKHGGGHTSGSGQPSCFLKLGCHSRKSLSSRPSRTAQRTCSNRCAPSQDQRMGWRLPIL